MTRFASIALDRLQSRGIQTWLIGSVEEPELYVRFVPASLTQDGDEAGAFDVLTNNERCQQLAQELRFPLQRNAPFDCALDQINAMLEKRTPADGVSCFDYHEGLVITARGSAIRPLVECLEGSGEGADDFWAACRKSETRASIAL